MSMIIKNTLLRSTAAAAVIGAMTMTAPTLASAKNIQPNTADYSFTIEDKYKGTATRKLTNSGNSWQYNMSARVAGVPQLHKTVALVSPALVSSQAAPILLIKSLASAEPISSALTRAKNRS